jgi:hypothetical protein
MFEILKQCGATEIYGTQDDGITEILVEDSTLKGMIKVGAGAASFLLPGARAVSA